MKIFLKFKIIFVSHNKDINFVILPVLFLVIQSLIACLLTPAWIVRILVLSCPLMLTIIIFLCYVLWFIDLCICRSANGKGWGHQNQMEFYSIKLLTHHVDKSALVSILVGPIPCQRNAAKNCQHNAWTKDCMLEICKKLDGVRVHEY